jgi:hypothetical protein
VAEQSDARGAADRAVCQWRAYSGGPVIAVVLRISRINNMLCGKRLSRSILDIQRK